MAGYETVRRMLKLRYNRNYLDDKGNIYQKENYEGFSDCRKLTFMIENE